jgi:hypothetical protein
MNENVYWQKNFNSLLNKILPVLFEIIGQLCLKLQDSGMFDLWTASYIFVGRFAMYVYDLWYKCLSFSCKHQLSRDKSAYFSEFSRWSSRKRTSKLLHKAEYFLRSW